MRLKTGHEKGAKVKVLKNSRHKNRIGEIGKIVAMISSGKKVECSVYFERWTKKQKEPLYCMFLPEELEIIKD